MTDNTTGDLERRVARARQLEDKLIVALCAIGWFGLLVFALLYARCS